MAISYYNAPDTLEEGSHEKRPEAVAGGAWRAVLRRSRAAADQDRHRHRADRRARRWPPTPPSPASDRARRRQRPGRAARGPGPADFLRRPTQPPPPPGHLPPAA